MLEYFGPYKVVKELGRGGMGSVLEGVDGSTGERRAIKVLSEWFAEDEDFRRRFRAEIETLKKLDHENIVRLKGFGEQEGHLFYTMELVDGPNLQQVSQQGHVFTWQEVVKMSIQICAALKHAHDRGVVHRDLKPANLMWADKGTGPIKLTDFGIAKLFGSTQMTMAGGVIGTADYMSPEQAAARPVTHRSDLYSLGSVMYSLLTKRPPFRGPSKTQVLDDLLHRDVIPIGRLVFGVPDELELIVGQLLEKNPEDRISTALILSRRLRALMHAHERGVLDRIHGDTDTDADGDEDEEFDVHVELGQTRNVDRTELSQPAQNRESAPKTKLPNQTHASTSIRATHASSELEGDVGETLMSNATSSTQVDDSPPTSTTTFTEVDQSRQTTDAPVEHQADGDSDGGGWQAVVGVCVAFVAVVLAGVWLSRPPSPEDIYEPIRAVADLNDHSKWFEVRDKMDDFLRVYPDDGRAEEVASWRDDHEWYKLWRKFERQSNKDGGDEFLTPCQQAFLTAARLDNADQRQEALAAYEALAGAPCSDDEGRQVLALAAHRQEVLRSAVSRNN